MRPTTVRFDNLQKFVPRLTEADARGHYTIGKEMVDSVIDRIRRVAGEFCAHVIYLQSLMLVRQLLFAPRLFDLPLVRRWYRFWFRCAFA